MDLVHARRLGAGAVVGVALAASVLTRAAVPSSGTLSASSGAISWDGPSTGGTSPDGEATCIDGTTCDVFTLKVAPGDYSGKRVRFKVTWSIASNDYDVYVHQSTVDGAIVGQSGNGAPSTAEESTFDLNGVVTAGVNDVFIVHIVDFTVTPLDPYHAVVSLESIPTTTTRTASFVQGSKTGVSFSHNRPVYAFGSGQDVEPNARIDYQGNAYVGGIRGLTGGTDLWRFDLNPSSPTYDPFLTAATPQFDASGSVNNPAWKGQPDALSPNDPSDLGGDGGGDMDLAVGFKPAVPTSAPPTLALSSLVAANVSAQRSTDRGDTITNNPSGNTTVQVDDRQWMEFLGANAVYLGYREFTGLQATSKYYLNRSDDGGLTYGPAVVAAIGGSTTGNIDVDQRDGTVYFCHQGDGTPGNNEVRVAVGHPVSLGVTPVQFTTHVAAVGQNQIANLFPVCKVASDGTVYVAYSDGGTGIYIAHSFDQGTNWAPPVRVSDVGPNGVALFPWIETGERPGSLAIVWYGATAADSEDGKGGNTDNANWKVYFAETLNATSSSPTVLQTVASDHFIHGSNISLAGFTTGTSPNRNLADFFQVAVDPQGFAMIAYADDSSDFAGHTYVTHQVAGYSLKTGKALRLKGTNAPVPVVTKAPQVFDFRHDARAVSPPPTMPDMDSPADILTIGYGCQLVNGATWVAATMRLSGLDSVPPLGVWRMNFATNPTKPGLVDRADQWYMEADTDSMGNRTYVYGTAVRNSDGSIAYTPAGAADAGAFDLTSRSVTVKVDVARLNALQKHGALAAGTVLMGLRGSASARVTVGTPAGTVAIGYSDSTRSGGTFTIGSCPR
jgi:hypothetical protein